jgi:hypothetical protein
MRAVAFKRMSQHSTVFVQGERQKLTTSSVLPLNILSVVAAMFPPFLCKSHAICRRSCCGNMDVNWSIWAAVILAPPARRFAAAGCPALGAGLENIHRMVKAARTMKTTSWGTFSVCSVIAAIRTWISDLMKWRVECPIHVLGPSQNTLGERKGPKRPTEMR